MNLAARRIQSADFSLSNHSLLKRISVVLRVENLVDLRHVSLGIAHDLFRAERRAGGGTAGGIADHAGEVADQEDDGVAEILKMLELAQQHGVAEMQVGRSGIESGFDPQRFAGGQRLFEFRAQFRLPNDFRGAFLDVGELFVNRGECGHGETL